MRSLVLATIAAIGALVAHTANAEVVTFSAIASNGSLYLPGGPYQEADLQFYAGGGPLLAGIEPYFPVGTSGPTLATTSGAPLFITLAGGNPNPVGTNDPFNLISLDVSYVYFQPGGVFRYDYIDATGSHGGITLPLDNISGLQTIALNLTNVLGLIVIPTGPGYQIDNVTYTIAAVPEPSTWAMMILGFAGIGYMAYRRQGIACFDGRTGIGSASRRLFPARNDDGRFEQSREDSCDRTPLTTTGRSTAS